MNHHFVNFPDCAFYSLAGEMPLVSSITEPVQQILYRAMLECPRAQRPPIARVFVMNPPMRSTT